MTTQGIIVLDLIGIVLLVWILDLTRRGRLYVGYGALFVVTILSTIVVISIPPVLATVTRLVGALVPVSALTLLALGFIVLMLVYILTQLSVFSDHFARVVQELAIRQANEDRERELAQVGGRLRNRGDFETLKLSCDGEGSKIQEVDDVGCKLC